MILVPHTLVPQGMCDLSAQTPALEVLSLRHWTTRGSLYLDFMKSPALTCLLIYLVSIPHLLLPSPQVGFHKHSKSSGIALSYPPPPVFFFFFLVAPFPVLGSSGSMESQPLDHREFPLNSFSFLECRPTFIFPFRDFTGCVEDSFPRAWAIKVTDFFKAISDVKKPSKTRPSGGNHPQLS